MIRHVDCTIWYTLTNRYKAITYLNGAQVQEMFDFSLQELGERMQLRINELNATSSTSRTKAVLWTTQSSAWDGVAQTVQIQASSTRPCF